MSGLITIAFLIFLIYLYIKFWSWLGGKVGGFIGRLIDGSSNRHGRR